MIRSLLVLVLVASGVWTVSGKCSASILARPPVGSRGEQSKINRAAGFIANNSNTPEKTANNDEIEGGPRSPSVVSLGIRSSCARKKMATVKDERAASAATRLRGGNTHLGQPPPMLGRRTYDQDPPKELPPSNPVRTLHNCADGSPSQRGQFAAAEHNMVEDPRTYDQSESWEDEEERDNRRLNMDAGGGGGGGGVGSMPSFPRTLPPAKAPLNKKFAWVP